jgi:NADH dehydrogenase (ubiquinone) 1 beta subcomplex subunit 7
MAIRRNLTGAWLGSDGQTLTHRKQQERHSYEKCQYVEFKKRVAKMDELRAAKGGARSN